MNESDTAVNTLSRTDSLSIRDTVTNILSVLSDVQASDVLRDTSLLEEAPRYVLCGITREILRAGMSREVAADLADLDGLILGAEISLGGSHRHIPKGYVWDDATGDALHTTRSDGSTEREREVKGCIHGYSSLLRLALYLSSAPAAHLPSLVGALMIAGSDRPKILLKASLHLLNSGSGIVSGSGSGIVGGSGSGSGIVGGSGSGIVSGSRSGIVSGSGSGSDIVSGSGSGIVSGSGSGSGSDNSNGSKRTATSVGIALNSLELSDINKLNTARTVLDVSTA